MSVTLREKPIAGGKVSLYLDIYHNRTRWTEALNIHISAKRPTQEDKEKRELAKTIRATREHDLLVNDNGLVNKRAKEGDFITWYEKTFKDGNPRVTSTLGNIKLFMGGKVVRTPITKNGRNYFKREIAGNKPLPFNRINEDWCIAFRDFVLERVSNNTAWDYTSMLFTALEKAAKKKIIPNNPMRYLDKGDRVKKKEIARNPFTIEQLQYLANTECNIHPQVRQSFFFDNYCGLRWGDFNALKWEQILIRKENWFIQVVQRKTGNYILVPLPDQAVEILKERKSEMKETGDNSPYVFPAIVGRYDWYLYSLKRLGRAAVAQFPECGIAPKMMQPHNARRAFATNTLEASEKGDIYTVSKLLGHASLNSIKPYVQIRDKRKMEAVQAIPKINLQVIHKKAA